MRGFLTINHNNLIFFFKLFGVYKKALTFAAVSYTHLTLPTKA